MTISWAGRAVDYRVHLRVASWLNEIQTRVDAVIYNLLPVDAVFLLQIRVESSGNIFNNGIPARMERGGCKSSDS
jgi:hypothetical protein